MLDIGRNRSCLPQQYKMSCLLGIFLVETIFSGITSSKLENNVTRRDTINGQMLVKLGRQITKIGLALQKLHRFEEWSSWTECEANRLGIFGIRTRTRVCNAKIRSGDRKGTAATETDLGICAGSVGASDNIKYSCPRNYNFTSNGFCIKLYTEPKTNDEAVEQCRQDGGYLINVDSDEKYVDMKSILEEGPPNVNVGGRRKGTSFDWEFEYGANNRFYSYNWYSGYPRNIGSYNCLILEGFKWWNHYCDKKYPFLCEII